MISTFTNREFEQETSQAMRAAAEGPVYAADRDHPSYVLLNDEQYLQLLGAGRSIVDQLAAAPGTEDIDLEVEPSRELARGADLD